MVRPTTVDGPGLTESIEFRTALFLLGLKAAPPSVTSNPLFDDRQLGLFSEYYFSSLTYIHDQTINQTNPVVGNKEMPNRNFNCWTDID